jgi:hypothetical protein
LTAFTVYIGTYNRGIFRSNDCGATWTHLNTGTNGDQFQGGGSTIRIDPTDPNVMYGWLNYGAGGVWKSTDGGVSWAHAWSGEAVGAFIYDFVADVVMDPTNPQHLVAVPHGGCPHSSGGCLLETTDGTTTWHLRSAPAWMEGASIIMLDSRNWLNAGAFGFTHSTDGGATWNPVSGVGGAYPSLYRAQNGGLFLPAHNGLVSSTDGITWTLTPYAGRSVYLIGTGTSLYACDQWSPFCQTALESNLTSWSPLAAPSDLTPGDGFVSGAYDREHHVMYWSAINTATPGSQGGLWRMVVP